MISYMSFGNRVCQLVLCRRHGQTLSKFDNMIPYGKQEVSYTYPKGEGNQC